VEEGLDGVRGDVFHILRGKVPDNLGPDLKVGTSVSGNAGEGECTSDGWSWLC
jgi:hypothetical protein